MQKTQCGERINRCRRASQTSSQAWRPFLGSKPWSCAASNCATFVKLCPRNVWSEECASRGGRRKEVDVCQMAHGASQNLWFIHALTNQHGRAVLALCACREELTCLACSACANAREEARGHDVVEQAKCQCNLGFQTENRASCMRTSKGARDARCRGRL